MSRQILPRRPERPAFIRTALMGAALAAFGLPPETAPAQQGDGAGAPPLTIPYTGGFGINGSGSSKNRSPLETVPRPDPGFLPSPVNQPANAAAVPTLPDYRADYAFADYQRGFYKAALQGALLRVGRNPQDGAAMTLLAEIYAHGLGVASDPAKARSWYESAAAQNDANALFALAMLVLEDGAAAAEPEKSRKHGEALALLQRAVDRGHPLAAYNLAVALIGERQQADLARAIDLLRQAAEREVPDAQYALAVLLREGRGVAPDAAAAAQWMARAAANGYLDAQVELAIMLFNGTGIEASEGRAARLFSVAAARGNAIAQNRLARIQAAGRGLPRDLVSAAAWHLMASRQGRADPWLDSALKSLSPDERGRAEALARERTEDINFGLEP
ncbi:tetratricopeptide repeat protein [Pseudochelatococcus sp. B33]